ncbi:MAG: hypothetical protein U0992_17260 [Planctomycetaceae bacterium]
MTQRLQREGRWKAQAEQTRDELMRSSKAHFKTKEERQAWVYGELDRMYPPLGETDSVPGSRGVGGDNVTPDAGQIQGLADIPEAWPELPSNASLASEIGWVQANRLRIVSEKPGGATRVRLQLAIGPAPSWAAAGLAGDVDSVLRQVC